MIDYPIESKRVLVAGGRGMVGSAIARELTSAGCVDLWVPERGELDCVDQQAVRAYFAAHRFDAVFIAAAKVGGIYANENYPAEFIYENLMIQSNLIHESWRSGVERLVFLGSSCIYPREAEQPIQESQLLKGPLEPTNEPYAVAKIAGIKMCESYNRQHQTDFRSAMPTNLYGTGDNYQENSSHVIPSLIRRFHEAKVNGSPAVTVWGTGKPMREFLHVDDLASALVKLMLFPKSKLDTLLDPRCSHVNIGTGSDLAIAELAAQISGVVGYSGEIRFDDGMPDGTPRKCLDTSLIRGMGWCPSIDLSSGLKMAYEDFKTGTVRT